MAHSMPGCCRADALGRSRGNGGSAAASPGRVSRRSIARRGGRLCMGVPGLHLPWRICLPDAEDRFVFPGRFIAYFRSARLRGLRADPRIRDGHSSCPSSHSAITRSSASDCSTTSWPGL